MQENLNFSSDLICSGPTVLSWFLLISHHYSQWCDFQSQVFFNYELKSHYKPSVQGIAINILYKCSGLVFSDWRRKWKPTPVFLPGESQGWGSLVGCHLWGRTESDTTEAT